MPAVDERLVMPEARAEIINSKAYFGPILLVTPSKPRIPLPAIHFDGV